MEKNGCFALAQHDIRMVACAVARCGIEPSNVVGFIGDVIAPGLTESHNPCAAAFLPANLEKTTLRVCPVQDG